MNDVNDLYCQGHLVYRNNRCSGCRVDKYNSQCPDFVPITIRIFEAHSQETVSKVSCFSKEKSPDNSDLIHRVLEVWEDDTNRA